MSCIHLVTMHMTEAVTYYRRKSSLRFPDNITIGEQSLEKMKKHFKLPKLLYENSFELTVF